MARIVAVAHALPEHRYDHAAMREIGTSWLHSAPELRERFERFMSASHLEQRFFSQPSETILRQNGIGSRAAAFETLAPNLGYQAVSKALNASGLAASAVDRLIFTSCSCPSIPAIDALLIERSGMARTTRRLPIYQHGCAGGVVSLGIAADMADRGEHVVVSAVELCSLVFNGNDPSPAELVGSAIFADGAASAVIAPGDGGLRFVDHQSYLVPDSRHLMGYNILDDGFHLRLERELPKVLSATAPKRVADFLAEHSRIPGDIAYWLFHPGGVKILDLLEATFALEPRQARWSREVLSSIGNLSSATVLVVLQKFLESTSLAHGDLVVMLGVGPGLTIELILFEYRDERHHV